jgi:hypothetical protein
MGSALQLIVSQPMLDRIQLRPPVTRRRRSRRRWVVGALLLVVLALPVPWLHLASDDPVGHAWRLDGRLHIEGEAVDPNGEWSWLAVGRPPLVAELIRDRVLGDGTPTIDLRGGPTTHSPALSEPAAVAVGLRHAGLEVPLRLLVEASRPHYEELPDHVVITEIAGIRLTERGDWDRVVGGWERAEQTRTTRTTAIAVHPSVDFAIRDGRSFSIPGTRLPYDRIDILDLAPLDLDASIAGPLTHLAPVSWFRDLSLGSSHGMMVALMAYSHASGNEIAQSRHLAGSGGIQGDGTVTRIGGLPSKARAAKRAGADVLLFPASQVGELESFDRTGITLVPVETLDDAIRWLANPMA